MTTVADIRAALDRYRIMYVYERELQGHLADVFARERIPFAREVRLSRTDRIDFLVDDRVGIETKVGGNATRLMAQLQRYAHSDRVEEILVITSRSTHGKVPATIGDVPTTVHILRSWG